MKKLDILESRFRHTIDDCVIDYQVHFDITGRVYDVKPLLYDLPESSQRLALGENIEQKKQKIENFKFLIELILPLGIVNQDIFFKEELKAIHISIQQSIIEHQLSKDKLYEYAESNSFAFDVLSIKQNPSFVDSDDAGPMLGKAMMLIKDSTDEDNTLKNIKDFITYYPHFALKMIPILIPFLEHSADKKEAFRALGAFVDEACKNYLIDELDKYQDEVVLRGIMMALSEQHLDSDIVLNKLSDIYYSEIKLSAHTKNVLLSILKHFPGEKTISICEDIVSQNLRHTSPIAAELLLNLDYPTETIAKFFVPKFAAADPEERARAFYLFSLSSKMSSYLPSSKELIQIYIDTFKLKQDTFIGLYMPNILQYKGDENAAIHMVEYLSSQNPIVLKAIIRLINGVLEEDIDIDIQPLMTNQAEKRYIELLNHDKLYDRTLEIIKIIGVRKREEKHLHLLLDQMDFKTKNSFHNLRLMIHINVILEVVPYDDSVTFKYLPALKDANENVRVTALEGLRYAKNQELKASLSFLKDDPSDMVLAAYANLSPTSGWVNY